MRHLVFSATIATLIILTAGCGKSDSKKSGDSSSKDKTYTLKTSQLKDGVVTPLDLASYGSAAVLSCHSEMTQKQLQLGTDPDCTDAETLKKINSQLAEIVIGTGPGEVDINIIDESNFVVTARSVSIDGPGIITWRYGRKSGESNYIGSCQPDIKDYCKNSKIVEYASSKAAEKIAQG